MYYVSEFFLWFILAIFPVVDTLLEWIVHLPEIVFLMVSLAVCAIIVMFFFHLSLAIPGIPLWIYWTIVNKIKKRRERKSK